jgi:hypothetical protein
MRRQQAAFLQWSTPYGAPAAATQPRRVSRRPPLLWPFGEGGSRGEFPGWPGSLRGGAQSQAVQLESTTEYEAVPGETGASAAGSVPSDTAGDRLVRRRQPPAVRSVRPPLSHLRTAPWPICCFCKRNMFEVRIGSISTDNTPDTTGDTGNLGFCPRACPGRFGDAGRPATDRRK